MAAIHRPLVHAAAIATAATLGASALALPAFAAEKPAAGATADTATADRPAAGGPQAPTVFSLADGTLDWGLKKSFREYVKRGAAGTITTSGGATQAPDNGAFTFGGAKGTYDLGGNALTAAFQGGVRFTSTAHRFDITIADVRVRTRGTTGAIQADVALNGARQDDIDLATLDLTGHRPGQGEGGTTVLKDLPAKLTAAGAKAFNGMYQEGEVLDPATLTVKPGAPVPDPDPKPSPSTSATPRPTKTPTAKPTPTATPKPTTAPAKPKKVVGGTLSWGLKESFRRYVSAGGTVTTAGGAKKKTNGYVFPYAKATWDARAKKVNASFGGSVRFRYKAHGIDMTFSDLRIKAAGAKGTLYTDVKAQGRTSDNVKFATLDLSRVSYAAKNDVVLLSKVPARFTAAGAKQFANETTGSPYRAGDRIDPVTVALELSAGARTASVPDDVDAAGSGGAGAASGGSGGTGPAGSVGGGSGSLARTGSGAPSGALLGVAGAVVATGAGAVYAARRQGPGHEARV
ncbi:HtaA domain-containing protein [Streptomyces longispororuber]|uniref:HtaA domain-containing protein n=1 Tax=Streptomyces longispororuber TaxID=68230 RepID=UPI003700DDEC